jgi:PAS domain S-box-containing protein
MYMGETIAHEHPTLSAQVDIDRLQKLQDRFSEVTEISSVVIDLDGKALTRVSLYNPVCRLIGQTEEGRFLCNQSDEVRNERARNTGQAFYHRCLSCGFIDASVPIIVDGNHVANWLIGQVKASGIKRDDIRAFARKIGANAQQVLEEFDKLPRVSIEKLEKMMELVRQMAADIARPDRDGAESSRGRGGETDREKPETMSTDTIEHLLNLSPAIILRCGPGPDYAISYISDNVVSRLGYVPDQFYEDPEFWRDRVHPEDLAAVEEARRGLTEGRLVDTEYRFRSRDNNWMWLHEQITPFFDTADARFGHILSWSDVTSRKMMGRQLQESVAELRQLESIVNRSPAILFVWSLDEKLSVEYVSQSVERWGYSPEDFTSGKIFWPTVVHPDDYPRVDREFTDYVKRGVTEFVQEYRLFDAAGEMRWVEDRNRVICDELGEPTHVQSIVLEVTDSRRAEQELKISRQRLRALLDATYDSMALMDRDGVILEANRAMAERLGRSPEEVIGVCIWDLLPPEILKTRQAWNRQVLESGKPHRSIDQRAGYWFDSMVYPVFDDDGRVVGTAAFARDITRFREVDQALKQSEARWQSIMRASPTGMGLVINRVIKSVNARLCEMTGYAADELVNYNARKLYRSEDDFQRVGNEKYRQMKQTGLGTIETKLVRKDGTAFDALVSSSPVDPNDPAAGVSFTVTDITERKQAAAELAKAQKLESVGVLAAGLAHDFNNALGGILSSVSLAMTDVDPDSELYSILKTAETATVRAADLTGRLLTFSRGGVPVKNRIRLETVVRDATELALSGTKVRARFEFAADLFGIDGDQSQLAQAFQNILINSCQAMPDGGEVQVTACNDSIKKADASRRPPGDYVIVSVIDRGKGIASEDLERVFDPFFTTQPSGSGLGLTTSYSIVKNHGGRIAIDSKLNVGTTVRVYLPAVHGCDARSAASDVADGNRPIPYSSETANDRLLVMDDETVLRDMMTRILAREGYRVEGVADGDRAVEAFVAARDEGDPYTLVLLDLTVPGGCGGVETLRRLQQIDPEIRAIVCSGYNDDPVISDFLKHGFVGAILKPFSASQLKSSVAKLVKKTM